MKKTFSLSADGRDPQRVIDAIKHDVRKYVKRERRKPVPADADFWDFACKVGASAEIAEPKRLNEINPAIDAVARTGASSVYVEIIAVHGRHVRHTAAPGTSGPMATPGVTSASAATPVTSPEAAS